MGERAVSRAAERSGDRRKGLAWIDTEAQTRFGAGFAGLSPEQKIAICDDICFLPKAKPEHRAGAEFFAKFRNLTAGGYYTTAEGMKDIGYVGNIPLPGVRRPTAGGAAASRTRVMDRERRIMRWATDRLR
jgi:hypothetical protein